MVGFSILSASILTLAVTRSAFLVLVAGFGTCWTFTLMGVVPLWTSLLCSFGAIAGVAAWRLWVRD